MNFTLEQLNNFLGKAALATYAGGGENLDPEKHDFVSRFPGFKELEYREGDWYYRDSYTGFFLSAGQEVVWYKGKPVWTQLYGGGMEEKHRDNEDFAHQTFSFLKKALSSGEKVEGFQSRGEKEFIEGGWRYQCDWEGDIAKFKGDEKISYNKEVVFTHHFFGGLVKQSK